MRALTQYLVIAIFFTHLTSPSLYAFKLRTHAYLGQKVINDLRQCWAEHNYPCVQIKLSNDESVTLRVSEATANAILANERDYLVGTFGPDAFADIVSGQTVIHPGVPNYGTGDWLSKLFNQSQTPQEKAFSYGFAGHAAADTFAHSYVNMYAGDIFELDDGETDVEQRHMMLESLIDHKTPDLSNYKGESLGDTYNYLGAEKLRAPLDFIANSMLFDDESARQYAKVKGGQHLKALKDLRDELLRALYKKNLGDASIQSFAKRYIESQFQSLSIDEEMRKTLKDLEGAGTVQKIEVLAMTYVAYYYAKVYLTAAEADRLATGVTEVTEWIHKNADDLVKIKDRIDKKRAEFEKYQDEQISALSEAVVSKISQLNDAILKYASLQLSYEKAVADEVKALADKQSKFAEKLCAEEGKVCKKLTVVNPVTNVVKYPCQQVRMVSKTFATVCEKNVSGNKCRTIKIFGKKKKICDPFTYVEKFTCSEVKKVPETFNAVCERKETKNITSFIDDAPCLAAQKTCKAKNDSIRAVQNGAFAAHDLTLKAKTAAFNELSNQKQQIDSILTSLKQEVDRVLATKRGLNEKIDNLDNAIVAMSNSLIVDLRLFIEQWESGVVAGGKDWIQANGQAMLNSTFQGENGPSIADPLTRWIHCRLPVVAGVPIAIADNTFCGVHDGIADATQKIDAAEAKLLDKLRSVDPNGPLAYVIDQFRYLKEHGPVLAGEKTHELFEKLGNDPVGDIGLLGHAFHGVHKGDHDTINHQFAVDNSPNHKGLMKFENESFVKRIFFDMGFPENQEQEYFDVDTYAVMRNALNLMKLSLLESNEINRLLKTLGDSGEQYGKNGMTDILSPWLRSIDGNHQWLDVAPPYLRVEGKKDTLFEDSCNDVTNLSRRFKKPNAAGQDNFPMYKSDVFSKIFKGPLAPALEVVRDSFINRIPSNYLYKVTAEFPFPALNITCN